MSQEKSSTPLPAALTSRDELQSIFDAAPVTILVAHDPQCQRITGNPFAYAMLGLPAGNISRSAPQGEIQFHNS